MKNRFNDLSYDEMIVKRDELKEQYRKLRFDKVVGHIESPIEIRTIRRSIARLNYKIHNFSLLAGENK